MALGIGSGSMAVSRALDSRALDDLRRIKERSPFAAIALLLAVAATGVAVGSGQTSWLLGVIAIGTLFGAVWMLPDLAPALTLIAGVSFPLFGETKLMSVGSVSLYTTDVALILLVVATALRWPTLTEEALSAVRTGFAAVAPFLVVLGMGALSAIFGHESWTGVGATMRPYAWYITVPLFAALLWDRRSRKLTLLAVHGISAITSVLMIAGDSSVQAARMIGDLFGTKGVSIPNYAGAVTRLNFSGMLLVPFAIALLLGERLYAQEVPRGGIKTALLILYGAGLLSTFGRGMWLWTALAVVAVALLRFDSQVAARLAAVAVVSVLLLVAASLMLGARHEMPGGLLGLVQFRLASVSESDANVAVRLLEDRQVLRQIAGSELLGVGLGPPLGVYSGTDRQGLAIYAVHNGYFAILGRFGMVGLAASLLFVGWMLFLGVQAFRRASGARLALTFAALVGLLRAALSSWTQSDTVSMAGIMVIALCAGLVLILRFANDFEMNDLVGDVAVKSRA